MDSVAMISDSPPPPPDPSSIPLPDGGEMGEREEAMEDDDEDGPVIDYRNNYSYNPHHQQPPQQLDPWTYLARLGTRLRSPTDPFLADGDAVCGVRQCTYLTQDDEEEFLHPEHPEFPCPAPECPATFTLLLDFESHYSTLHRHECAQCGRTLPSAHLLELHLAEAHDSFFAVMSKKNASYECFLQKCRDKFWSPEERKGHCIKKHQFPSDFQFGDVCALKSTPSPPATPRRKSTTAAASVSSSSRAKSSPARERDNSRKSMIESSSNNGNAADDQVVLRRKSGRASTGRGSRMDLDQTGKPQRPESLIPRPVFPTSSPVKNGGSSNRHPTVNSPSGSASPKKSPSAAGEARSNSLSPKLKPANLRRRNPEQQNASPRRGEGSSRKARPQSMMVGADAADRIMKQQQQQQRQRQQQQRQQLPSPSKSSPSSKVASSLSSSHTPSPPKSSAPSSSQGGRSGGYQDKHSRRRFSLAVITGGGGGNSSSKISSSDVDADARSVSVFSSPAAAYGASASLSPERSFPSSAICDSTLALSSVDVVAASSSSSASNPSTPRRAPLSLARMGERLSTSSVSTASSVCSIATGGGGGGSRRSSDRFSVPNLNSAHNSSSSNSVSPPHSMGGGGGTPAGGTADSPARKASSRIPVFMRSSSCKVPRQICFGSDAPRAFDAGGRAFWHSGGGPASRPSREEEEPMEFESDLRKALPDLNK